MVYRWGESPGVSWLVLHVQEIKELLRRWKGGSYCTASKQRGEEGGGKTKTQAEKQWREKKKKKKTAKRNKK